MKYDKMKSVLLECLREAGSLVRSSLCERHVVEKKTELSIVTQTDLAAEKIILDRIRTAFPDHAILSEESPASGNSASRWIIDPIDGTTNFAHSYPVSCISIGYEEGGEVLLGGVYDPFRDELFFAEKGKGAFLNKKQIRVSETAGLAEALVATGFPYDRRDNPDVFASIIRTFIMTTQGIRRTGSSAIDLCYIACGRFDGYCEVQLKPWDMAAGSLMVREAGGRLSDYSGGPHSIEGMQTVATNGLIHEAMLAELKPYAGLSLSGSSRDL